jgi:hypothetical protein
VSWLRRARHHLPKGGTVDSDCTRRGEGYVPRYHAPHMALDCGQGLVADMVCDEVRHPDNWPSTLRERVAELTAEAVNAVAGQRNADYGDPLPDMAATAEMMNGYLHKRGLLASDAFLQPFDVPALLLTIKLSRLAGKPGHHDSMVDVIGWTGVYQECVP